MSTIDDPKIIVRLLRDKGVDAQMKSHNIIDLGGRRTAETIWEYISGFGTKCYKLIYGLYPNSMNEEEASAIFLATANIRPGTEVKAILYRGQLTDYGKQFLDSNPST